MNPRYNSFYNGPYSRGFQFQASDISTVRKICASVLEDHAQLEHIKRVKSRLDRFLIMVHGIQIRVQSDEEAYFAVSIPEDERHHWSIYIDINHKDICYTVYLAYQISKEAVQLNERQIDEN